MHNISLKQCLLRASDTESLNIIAQHRGPPLPRQRRGPALVGQLVAEPIIIIIMIMIIIVIIIMIMMMIIIVTIIIVTIIIIIIIIKIIIIIIAAIIITNTVIIMAISSFTITTIICHYGDWSSRSLILRGRRGRSFIITTWSWSPHYQ